MRHLKSPRSHFLAYIGNCNCICVHEKQPSFALLSPSRFIIYFSPAPAPSATSKCHLHLHLLALRLLIITPHPLLQHPPSSSLCSLPLMAASLLPTQPQRLLQGDLGNAIADFSFSFLWLHKSPSECKFVQ